MMKIVKKLPALILACLLFFLTVLPAFAADVDSLPIGATDINLHSWTQISTLDIVSGLTCQITGFDPAKSDGKGCVFYGQSGLRKAEKPGGGVIAFAGNLIAAMYTSPPASGTQYVADLGRNLGIGKPVYAQEGTGFTRLSPLLPVWKAFRNLAYIFFTIIFIVIGFAIMFKVKISPQAVVTIQSAIPRIIIALVLVTFSYAIAGLLIDFVYVAIFLVISLLANAGAPSIGPNDIAGLQSQFSGSFFGVMQGTFQAVGGGMPTAFATLGAILGGIIGGIVSLPTGGFMGAGIGAGIGAGVAILILALLVVFILFKLFMELLKAYLSILVLIIFGPLQIMLGAIPGQSGFGTWFRNLLANILVFPAVAAFLLVGRMLVSLSSLNGEGVWTPPMFGFPSQVMPAIIGLGVLIIATKIPEMTKDAFQVKPFKYGTAIGEAMRPVAGPLNFGWRAARTVGTDVAQGYIGSKLPQSAQKYLRGRDKELSRADALRQER